MLLNLVVLCYIISVVSLPIEQDRYFMMVFKAIMRLSKTSMTSFINTVASFGCNLTYMRL